MQRQLVITNEHAVVKNHEVYGQPVLPGLAYLDLMYQYLDSLGHEFSEWELRDISIYQALKVLNAEGVVLSFADHAEPDGSVALRIEGTGGNGLYATARACRVGAARFDDTLDRQAIERSKLRITSTEVYEFQQSIGLTHGDFMRIRGTIYADSENVYAEAEVGDEARAASDNVIFHPALMDGSVICVAAGAVSVRPIADGLDSQLRLPVYIESFRATAPLRVRCTARLATDSMHTKGGAFYSTVDFFDERGEKVAELRNVASTAGLAGIAAVQGRNQDSSVPVRAEANEDAGAARDVESFLLARIAEMCGGLPEGCDATLHFAASQLDSASLLAVLQDLERRIGQPISPVAIFEYPTIRDLAGFLVETFGAAHVREKLAASDSTASVGKNGADTFIAPSETNGSPPLAPQPLPVGT